MYKSQQKSTVDIGIKGFLFGIPADLFPLAVSAEWRGHFEQKLLGVKKNGTPKAIY